MIHILSHLARWSMLSVLAVLAISTTADTPATEPDLTGTWAGNIQAARYDPVELIFHITHSTKGLSATLDIPSQQQHNITVDHVRLQSGLLTLRISSLQAEFYGGLQPGRDGTTLRSIRGDWAQSGEFVPLTLRPQQPTQAEQQ